jgi:hypothetical protein
MVVKNGCCAHCVPGGAMEADIHIIGATYTGLAALTVVSAQAVPSTSEEN